jgi:hypothetical protein
MIVTGWDFEGRGGLYRIDGSTGRTSPVALQAGGGDLLMMAPIFIGEAPDGALLYARQSARRTGPGDSAEFGVFRSVGAQGEREIARLHLGSRPDLSHLALSPDGRTIFFSRWSQSEARVGGGGLLIALDILSGRERTLFAGVTQRWSLSPDATTIVTGRVMPNEQSSVWVVPVTGDQPREILRGLPARVSGVLSVLLWAPDSKSFIASWGVRSGSPEVRWVPVDGRQPRLLDLGLGVGDFLQTVTLHPDGRRVAFHQRNITVDVAGYRTDLWRFHGLTTTSDRR